LALNYSLQVYKIVLDTLSRPVTIFPVASQPGEPPYDSRGIFDTRDINVEAQDGSIISDQRTILDIREAEFEVLPLQLDRVAIPAIAGSEDLGEYEVTDTDTNGGGLTTLTLRKLLEKRP
jgi:hypothetical protein